MKNQLPLLLQAMDSARDGITISDASLPDNPIIYANEGFLQMTGYTRDEIIGKNCRFLQGAATRQESITQIRTAVKNNQPIVLELLNYHKNGQAFWNNLSITPIYNTEGTVTHFVGVQNDISDKKHKHFLQQKIEQQQLITKATIEGQEKERQHIGRELHDNINQLMAAAKLFLNMASDDEQNRVQMIQSSTEIINTAITEIRKLSHALVGTQPDKFNLEESVTDLLATVEQTAPFTTSFHFNICESNIAEQKKLLIYRIIQEQLNNIIKHARAHAVSFTLEQTDNKIRMTVTDDGIGFDVTEKLKGIGLRNMETRLEMVNGQLFINSRPGNGCQMIITLPV